MSPYRQRLHAQDTRQIGVGFLEILIVVAIVGGVGYFMYSKYGSRKAKESSLENGMMLPARLPGKIVSVWDRKLTPFGDKFRIKTYRTLEWEKTTQAIAKSLGVSVRPGSRLLASTIVNNNAEQNRVTPLIYGHLVFAQPTGKQANPEMYWGRTSLNSEYLVLTPSGRQYNFVPPSKGKFTQVGIAPVATMPNGEPSAVFFRVTYGAKKMSINGVTKNALLSWWYHGNSPLSGSLVPAACVLLNDQGSGVELRDVCETGTLANQAKQDFRFGYGYAKDYYEKSFPVTLLNNSPVIWMTPAKN